MEKQNITILSGAGISAESGIQTFRGGNGLWDSYNVEDVASIDGWHRNRALVLEFYNKRRKELEKAQPNSAHKNVARLEEKYNVTVVTQNIDDLHERGGSTNIIHLHGEATKARSEFSDYGPTYIQVRSERIVILRILAASSLSIPSSRALFILAVR